MSYLEGVVPGPLAAGGWPICALATTVGRGPTRIDTVMGTVQVTVPSAATVGGLCDSTLACFNEKLSIAAPEARLASAVVISSNNCR